MFAAHVVDAPWAGRVRGGGGDPTGITLDVGVRAAEAPSEDLGWGQRHGWVGFRLGESQGWVGFRLGLESRLGLGLEVGLG